MFLHTNKLSETVIKTIPLTINSEIIKIPRSKSHQGGKNMYLENDMTLMKETEDDINK